MSTLAGFLRPEGFVTPHPAAVLHEARILGEAVGHLRLVTGGRRQRRSQPVHTRPQMRDTDPVLLVPGFLAGDGTLGLLSRWLRHQGVRTYRSHIRANVGCTREAAVLLEQRIAQIAARRESRVVVVGHSLGGMLARGLAVRRPDLISGIVTMGSPMLAPGAHHASLSRSVDLLVRLSRAGVPGLMAEDCVAGACARESFEEGRQPMPEGVGFTAIYSRNDGIVDWRACVDPEAEQVEVSASHTGMALDPRVSGHVLDAVRRFAAACREQAADAASVVEVDGGVLAEL